ncbi:MAG: DUF1957 domain-containing protein [Endomicrobium sp.]|nr:DUF1957 domain-containing protein [Endomicrobium sp.]
MTCDNSSDRAFVMSAGIMEYAEKRTKDHLVNFTNLYSQIKESSINEYFLRCLERKIIFSLK